MESKFPFLVWHFTNECNLHCDYCSQDAGSKQEDELTTYEKIVLVDQLEEVEPRMVGISGGEPMMADDFWEVLKYATQKIPICVGTNGFLLNEENVEKLSDLGVGIVNVSLYSTKSELHDKVRGRKGSFEKVVEGIKNLRKKKIKAELSIPLSQRNFGELEDLIKFGKSLKVNEIELIDFRLIGRAKSMPHEDLTHEQRTEIFQVAYENSNTNPRVWCFDAKYSLYRSSQNNSKGLSKKNKKEIIIGCQAGFDMYAIQPNGDVTPCTFLPDLKVGNVREERFKDIIANSSVLHQLRDRSNLEGYCGSCQVKENCGGCRSRAYYRSGNFLAEDPACKNLDFLKNGTKKP